MKDFTKEDLFNAIKKMQIDQIEAYKRYLNNTTDENYFYTEYTGVCLWWLNFESRKRLKLARALEKDGLIGLIKINKDQHNSPLKAYVVGINS